MLHSNEKDIKHKVGLLNLAQELGNVSKACKIMGLSRDMSYRYQSAVERVGWMPCWSRIGANPTSRIVPMEKPRPPWSNMPRPFRPTANTAPATRNTFAVNIYLWQRRVLCLATPWLVEFQRPITGIGSQGGQRGHCPDRDPNRDPGEKTIR